MNLKTGETTAFISRAGVYFLKMYIPKHLMHKHELSPADWSTGKPVPFGRPG